jgi:ABC-type branched-subunit amino acid transport system substrate-binding protein
MPAAYAAARRHMLFWETGAVGLMSSLGRGRLVFRVAPSGLELGGSAMDFLVRRLAPMLHRVPRSLRVAVAYADDAYGAEVARGAMDRVRALGVPLVARVPYDPRHLSSRSVVHRLVEARPDVVFVSAYLDDGVAIRREIVRERVPLLANIGTSSSYCMPAFGVRLGSKAVGVFASDKPAAEYINPRGLRPDARRLLETAASTYEHRYGEEMSAAALAGFSAAWALFHDVAPRANSFTPAAVAGAARSIRLPPGSLPNGSGLWFGRPGTTEAGWNLRAASVIWEWLRVDHEAVVWPPRLATARTRLLPA